jgi:ubiquinone/menaquinone biosynthesis C-methylase UbiE
MRHSTTSLITKAELRRKYDRFAPWYDVVEGLPELLSLRQLRRALLRRAQGHVLEVAAGTGRNFRHYPESCRITAVDLSAAMLARARQRAQRLGLSVAWAVMDAEALAFRPHSFDAVVSTLSLCTFHDPAAALREMARVCRPHGRLLLLDHGRSDRPRLARWQDRHAERHARRLGCHWNREPLQLARQAGLTVVAARRLFFGIFHILELAPS